APGAISTEGTKFILGAYEGGRDVLGQLIIGARNSVTIGFAITVITSIIGVGLGIISGFYGGIIDNILMRIVDFIMILPI
ncbi:dipeptide ABC transporter permease DppC, partial [Vibrio parahaemolyticus]|nr:dipeptide ABC transporter permease DppC [Vibrio parahaemolyticus]